jgi:hypothetical protein
MFATLVANSLTRLVGTCYGASPLLYPYFWWNASRAKLIQENAPSIDFDQPRYPSAHCNDYGSPARDA